VHHALAGITTEANVLGRHLRVLPENLRSRLVIQQSRTRRVLVVAKQSAVLLFKRLGMHRRDKVCFAGLEALALFL
jgi:hypothetical protein